MGLLPLQQQPSPLSQQQGLQQHHHQHQPSKQAPAPHNVNNNINNINNNITNTANNSNVQQQGYPSPPIGDIKSQAKRSGAEQQQQQQIRHHYLTGYEHYTSSLPSPNGAFSSSGSPNMIAAPQVQQRESAYPHAMYGQSASSSPASPSNAEQQQRRMYPSPMYYQSQYGPPGQYGHAQGSQYASQYPGPPQYQAPYATSSYPPVSGGYAQRSQNGMHQAMMSHPPELPSSHVSPMNTPQMQQHAQQPPHYQSTHSQPPHMQHHHQPPPQQQQHQQQQHTPQHPLPPSQTTSDSPRNGITPKLESLAKSQSATQSPRPPQSATTPLSTPTTSAQAGQINPSAAPGPIPATTPLVVRQDDNGVQWIAFEYSRDRVKMEYTIRCDVESVNTDALSPEFKQENCVYPRACCPKEEYRGNRLGYETECNQVGWALAELNPSLQGKRGLIQRAVDS